MLTNNICRKIGLIVIYKSYISLSDGVIIVEAFYIMISHTNDESDSGSDSECWSSWFCGTSGNDLFCQVKRVYIEDAFNLYGLKQYLPQSYNKALDLILDRLGKFIYCNKSHIFYVT